MRSECFAVVYETKKGVDNSEASSASLTVVESTVEERIDPSENSR
jgi:hypothetical protein